ncbi:MAG: HEPN domain-containing protein [Chloroflexota bacterium]|nr:HEPN domain-containing protein [Chloroflexota bacterium]
MSDRPYSHSDNQHEPARDDSQEELERLLREGTSFQSRETSLTAPPYMHAHPANEDEDDEDIDVSTGGDVQGAFGLLAEGIQDLATAGVELGMGRYFACADFCNQGAEKSAQAVSLLRFGRRSPYDHDLRALGARVGAPADIQEEMASLTPFHPEAFYAVTPPEEADDSIDPEQANNYLQSARRVMRWARDLIFKETP